ncbi:nucleotidyltransferase domain-containing protein [Sphingomonas adhaesiva]|uniref:nucleotidyltransferase domain-containing protein n=1 Tax=Sphingomonas adhaesiva TaxID=28212 RepID=UPI002FFA48E0
MAGAVMLARLLGDPAVAETLDAAAWTGVLTTARAEQLLGALAHRVEGLEMPAAVAAILHDARAAAIEARRGALWEAEGMRRTLAPLGVPLVLLKGTAFAAAGSSASRGRMIGDLDLLVPRDALDAVEATLLAAGWEWAKADRYDQHYYRRWMHELPPLIHPDRDRPLDVHHTILPPTARATPDAAAIIAAAVPLGTATKRGLFVPCAADMIVHAALHLFADGDLTGGLRNLWDIDRLLHDHATPDFWPTLDDRAALHGARAAVGRALRLAGALFGTPMPPALTSPRRGDALFRRRLLARDGWGRETRPVTRFAFYIRSHWIRMPAPLLARHLAIKAWRRVVPARS